MESFVADIVDGIIQAVPGGKVFKDLPSRRPSGDA